MFNFYFINSTFIVIVTKCQKSIFIYTAIHFLESKATLFNLNNFIAVVFIFSSLENIEHLTWLYTLQPKFMPTIRTAQVTDIETLTLQHPEVQYLRRVEFQGRARLPSSIAASQHVHLTPHLKQ